MLPLWQANLWKNLMSPSHPLRAKWLCVLASNQRVFLFSKQVFLFTFKSPLEQKSDRTLRFQILPSSCFLFWEWKNPRMLRKHTQPHHCQIWNLSMFAQNCQIWNLSMFTRLPLIPNPIVTYQIFQCLPSCQKIWNLSMFAQLSNTKSSNVYQTAAYRLYRIFQRLRECWLYWIFERLPECLCCCSPTRHTSFCPTFSCNKAGQTRQATLHSQSHKQISQLIQQEKMDEIADRNQNRRAHNKFRFAYKSLA